MLNWLSCYLPKQLTINPQRCLPDLESFSFKAMSEKAKPVDISIISVIKRFVWKAHNTYFKVFRPPTPSVGHKSINLITSHTQLTYPHSYFTLHATDRTNTVHNHPFIHWNDHITTSCPKTVAHNICIFELFWLFHIHMPTDFTSMQKKNIAILYAILSHNIHPHISAIQYRSSPPSHNIKSNFNFNSPHSSPLPSTPVTSHLSPFINPNQQPWLKK